MIIEKMSYDDIKVAAELEKRYIYHPYSEALLSELLGNPSCLALKVSVNGEMAGYISGEFVLDEFNINNVVIDERFRRNGYAVALISQIIDSCKCAKINKIYLEVAKSNYAAINLYNKLGFEFLYERKKYYGDESALVLIKNI